MGPFGPIFFKQSAGCLTLYTDLVARAGDTIVARRAGP
jgi:hypothetical protein